MEFIESTSLIFLSRYLRLHKTDNLQQMNKIELLAPAKNAEAGKIAINYGADAVYIGFQKFGARAAVGNSLKDISELASYAHLFNARVYVTVNTVLFDHELDEVQKLIYQLYELGVDAVIIQDYGILEMDLPPIPIFASTQMHNHNPEHILFLEKVGFKRAILARELSLKQIEEIRAATNIDLEFFVHGALCVCYSGQCYFSQAIKKGSANRGECAQPCRSYYDLSDKNGKTIAKNKFILSPKDLNLSGYLRHLMDAGISSFKIEGRLKDLNYVKNITAFYREKTDEILEGSTSFTKASSGKVIFDFIPDPEKSFNRGFTNYFIEGRKSKVSSFDSPKSLGKYLGKVQELTPLYFKIETSEVLANGDGLCFFDAKKNLLGLRLNKNEGGKLYPDSLNGLFMGAEVYRNHDQEMTKKLETSGTVRKIGVRFLLHEFENKIVLEVFDEDNNRANLIIETEKIPANNPEKAIETIKKQLSKSGETIFEVTGVEIRLSQALFFPASVLNDSRRLILEQLSAERLKNYKPDTSTIIKNDFPFPEKELDFKANIVNEKAVAFYKRHGVTSLTYGFEKETPTAPAEIMTTKYCVKFQMGLCTGKKEGASEDVMFMNDNQRKYKLVFDCNACKMKVVL